MGIFGFSKKEEVVETLKRTKTIAEGDSMKKIGSNLRPSNKSIEARKIGSYNSAQLNPLKKRNTMGNFPTFIEFGASPGSPSLGSPSEIIGIKQSNFNDTKNFSPNDLIPIVEDLDLDQSYPETKLTDSSLEDFLNAQETTPADSKQK